jgi:hypothetical protein
VGPLSFGRRHSGEPEPDPRDAALRPAPAGARPPAELVLRFTPEGVMAVLLGAIGAVVAAGLAARAAILRTTAEDLGIRELARRFDLDIEHNIPSWFASAALLVTAGLLAVVAAAAWRSRDRFRGHWSILSLLFVGLSIDEATSLHEMAMAFLHSRFDLGGIFFFAWVIPGAGLVGVLGIMYAGFLAHLTPRTRHLFVGAAVIYVGAALGLEAVGGMVVEVHGFESLRYSVLMLLEEILELLGIALFLYALLDHLRYECGGLQVHLSSPRQPSSPA